MAVANINPNMQGIGTNPGLTLKAPDFCAQGAEVVTDNSFLGGKAVRGIYQGQILMETGWFPSGTLNNIVLPTAYITGTLSATDAVSYYDNIIVTVYKRPSRDSLGEAWYYSSNDYETQEFTIHYINGISNTIGALSNAQQYNRPASNFLWFDTTYEYKFSVRVGRLTNGAYLDLAGIYLQFHTSTAVMGARQYQWSGLNTEAIPIIDGLTFSVTCSAGNFGPTVIGSEVMDGVGGIGGSTGIQSGLFNNIEAIGTNVVSTTVPDTDHDLMVYTQLSSTNGGYEVVAVGTGFGAAAVLVISVILYGHQTAQEM